MNLKVLEYDLVVIGAGPAGSSAARSAAQSGLKVLMIERAAQVGTVKACAGCIPLHLFGSANLPRSLLLQKVQSLKTILPDGQRVERQMPLAMIDRPRLDKELALRAVLTGAHLMTSTEAVGLEDESLVAQRGNEQFLIKARAFIGAFGTDQKMARGSGLEPQSLLKGMQHEVALPHHLPWAEVHFRKEIETGYGWLFPRGRTALVGLAMRADSWKEVEEVLHGFLHSLEGLLPFPLATSRGFIPVGGTVSSTVRGKMLLVGDAAGQCHPITGAGLHQAILCGQWAGEIAATAIQEDNLKALESYESKWTQVFGPCLSRASKKRRLLEQNWNNGPLLPLIKKTWVAFREYYEEA